LDHLQTLEAALTAEAALGGSPQAYAELQAALLAIRAGADTLRRLDIPEVERGDSPLVDPRALLSGEAS
jgi:cytosine/adenosine deaminase-related metal-dependent hydrolase